MLLFCAINLHSIPCGALFNTKEDNVHCDFKTGSSDFQDDKERSTIMEKMHNLKTAFDISMVTCVYFTSAYSTRLSIWLYIFSLDDLYCVIFGIGWSLIEGVFNHCNFWWYWNCSNTNRSAIFKININIPTIALYFISDNDFIFDFDYIVS